MLSAHQLSLNLKDKDLVAKHESCFVLLLDEYSNAYITNHQGIVHDKKKYFSGENLIRIFRYN